jgi:hypothetical protein
LRCGLTVAEATRLALSSGAARYELRRPGRIGEKSRGGWELWISREKGEPLSYYLYSPAETQDEALKDLALNWIDWNSHRYFIQSEEGFQVLGNKGDAWFK